MEVKTPIRLAVLELGDQAAVVQTLIALKATLKLFPRLEIDLITKPEHHELAHTVSFLKQIHYFDVKKIESKLDAVTQLEGILETPPYSVVFNTSETLVSSHLVPLIPGTLKLGIGRNLDGSICLQDGWTAFQYALKQSEATLPVHRIDVLATQLLTCLQLNFEDPAPGVETAISSKNFFSTAPDGPVEIPNWHDLRHKWIAFEMDALPFDSVLDEDAVASSCLEILKTQEDTSILIFGKTPSGLHESFFRNALTKISGNESKSLREKLQKNIFYFSKHFKFTRKIRLLSRMQLLITSDPYSASLASALGLRCLVLSSARESSDEKIYSSAPYGNGHYLTYAKTAQTLSAHLIYLLQEWRHQGLLTFDEFFSDDGQAKSQSAQEQPLFKSRILPPSMGGGVVYERAGHAPHRYQSWIQAFYNLLARDWLCGWTPPLEETLKALAPHEVRPTQLRETLESSFVLLQVLGSGLSLSRQLLNTCKSLRSEHIMTIEEIERIQIYGRDLRKIEELLKRVTHTKPELRIFSSLYDVLFNDLDSHRLSHLAQGSLEIFEMLIRGVEFYQNLAQNTLDQTRANLVPQRAKILRLERSPKV